MFDPRPIELICAASGVDASGFLDAPINTMVILAMLYEKHRERGGAINDIGEQLLMQVDLHPEYGELPL